MISENASVEFEPSYFVNRLGECFSNKSGVMTKLNIYQNKKGYFVVKPWINGKNVNMYVHRVVATSFVCNKESKGEVNHIDGDKGNNKCNNLEWVTHSENMYHASVAGLMNNNKRSKDVIGYFLGNGFWFPSTREAERHGFTSECISRVCLGKSLSHKGLKWEHVK